jgi:uncharacterized spore protein YtfJ
VQRRARGSFRFVRLAGTGWGYSNSAPMDPREVIKGAREALNVRQVFGEPVERDGVTVIPAATVIGGGGGGGGESGRESTQDGEAAQPESGFGSGFGGVMWPAGAFEISEGRVKWRPAIDLTRVLLVALALAIAVVRARGRRR